MIEYNVEESACKTVKNDIRN